MGNNIKKLTSVIFWALVLNTIWEFGQCLFLYNMWEWPFWKATVWMWAAIIGDIVIVLALWKITTALFSSVSFDNPKLKNYFSTSINYLPFS